MNILFDKDKQERWFVPENRSELFNRYFRWRVLTHDLDHIHYYSNLCENYDFEKRAWYSFCFGMTYRTPQAFCYTENFPYISKSILPEIEKWSNENYKRCTYGTDARYNKGFFYQQTSSIIEWLNGESFENKLKGIVVYDTQKKNFWALYKEILKLYKFGRMTAWITMQCLHDLCKLPIDPEEIILEGYSPNNDSSLGSIWNGLCAYTSQPEKMVGGKYGNYICTKKDIEWGSEFTLNYTSLAEEYSGFKIDSFRKESIWCQYKRLFNEEESKEYPGHACLTGETKISLLDGTEVMIKDLVGKKEFWVYSSTLDGKVVPGRGFNACITKTVDEICIVELDNGEEIKCTPDHKFLLKNGQYKEAKDLVSSDNLMPLYRRINQLGYREVKQNFARESYKLVYKLVGEIISKESAEVSMKKLNYNQLAIHHKDHNKLNDEPSNLEWITAGEHLAHHRENFQNTEKGKLMMSSLGKEYGPKNLVLHYNKSDKGRIKSSETMSNLHKRSEFAEKRNENGKNQLKKLFSDPDWVKEKNKRPKVTITNCNKNKAIRINQNIGRVLKTASYILSLGKELNEKNYNENKLSHSTPNYKTAITYFNSIEDFLKKAQTYNHKVKSVKIVKCDPIDVYDIQVENYNNFALTSGVFVHNSGDATSRYLYYRENWPEINWSSFRKALRSQPGLIKGITYVKAWNKLFEQTGKLLNMHELYSDMENLYEEQSINLNDFLVKELWEDDNLKVPEINSSRSSIHEDLKTCDKYYNLI